VVIENAELIAIIALGAMLFIGGVGAAYALENLPKRSEFNELHKEVAELRKEMNDKIDASHNELSDKIGQSYQNLTEELIAEIRRSHRQLMRALVTHRHLADDSEPVFAEPPDTELVAADN
jgi:uncharacterized membrane-anchored protein YhcB (DUF1043 family)